MSFNILMTYLSRFSAYETSNGRLFRHYQGIRDHKRRPVLDRGGQNSKLSLFDS